MLRALSYTVDDNITIMSVCTRRLKSKAFFSGRAGYPLNETMALHNFLRKSSAGHELSD